ncbi:MAG: response regulator [Desulfatiglandaceae bacterium]
MVNILIIDDQPHLGELLAEDLSMEGHRVICLKEAEDAMEELRSGRSDMVLLELYLNGFERWDLLHRIKLEAPHLPVLIVTPYDNFVGDPRLAEADGYVIKDIYPDVVIKKIEDIFSFQVQKRIRSPKKHGFKGKGKNKQYRQNFIFGRQNSLSLIEKYLWPQNSVGFC